MDEYQAIMTKKLGLPKYNKELISKLLNNMAVDKVDYTNFFRLLSNIKADPNIVGEELLSPLKAVLLDIGKERKEAWTKWVQAYIQEVKRYLSLCICLLSLILINPAQLELQLYDEFRKANGELWCIILFPRYSPIPGMLLPSSF